MTRAALLLLPLLLAGCANSASPPPGPAPDFDTAAMDALLSGAVERGDIIGVSALVFDEGKTVYRGNFGLRDRERGLPVTNDTVWRIYSMTKPITSALIMDLAEEGLVDLDAPASDYIPQLAEMKVLDRQPGRAPALVDQERPMTVKDLLLHRSGLAYGIFPGPVEAQYAQAGLLEPDVDLATKVERLADLPLLFQPGEMWRYSYSIDVLGRIAEVVTGERLDDLMEDRFFEPLGMEETSFRVQPDQAERFASNYAQTPGGFVLQDDAQTSAFLDANAFQSGGGGLVGTIDDYARFAQMMLDGGTYGGTRILEEETVAQMMSDQMEPNFTSVLPWIGGDTGTGFGYGGSVQLSATPRQQLAAGRYPGQWGWSGAARTTFYVDPANDAFGIIMLQFFSDADPEIHDYFQALALEMTRDAPLEPAE